MPTAQPVIVLDPGHGGSVPAGASTPDRSGGGLSEKTLTLDLARRVRALLAPQARTMLTRDSDTNLSLEARAGFARVVGADYFVSLHFNASADPGLDSTEVYVGRSSTDGDRGLAQALHGEVSAALGTGAGGVLAADLGVVARSRHLPRTSAALLEVCDLSNPRRAAQLHDPATLDRLAHAVAAALSSRLAAAPTAPPAAAATALGPVLMTPATVSITDAEWAQILSWQAAGAVGPDPLTADGAANALLVAGTLFCQRRNSSQLGDDPALCLTRSVTEADPRVVQLAGEVSSRGPIVNWSAATLAARQRYVVSRLVTQYGYPVNAAAGLVGNLTAESEVVPPRIEGSQTATPLTAKDFAGVLRQWTPQQVLERDYTAKTGPAGPGVGLAQWSYRTRRAAFFAYVYAGRPAGARTLFDIDAQIDFLVSELRSSFAGVQAVLSDPAVTLAAASDEVVYTFEEPRTTFGTDGKTKLARTDAGVVALFALRQGHSQAALTAYQAVP